MRLADFYSNGRFGLSYESFPPKDEPGMEELFRNLSDLVTFKPSYITCTYGAGGATRHKTLEVVSHVKARFNLPAGAHLTCVGSTREELRAYLREAGRRGIEYIVALRGDPPKGAEAFVPVDGGLRYANELVTLIREEFGERFGIAVAGYPEKHQEASTFEEDLDNLKRKVDAGADIVITQLFYDNSAFFRFRDACAARGIDVPIIPGILPITSLARIKRITSLCGATLPPQLIARLEAHADDDEGQFDAGVYHATKQVEELVEAGAPGVHFYVLNRSPATSRLLRALMLPPKHTS